jgi:hypothetical protein
LAVIQSKTLTISSSPVLVSLLYANPEPLNFTQTFPPSSKHHLWARPTVITSLKRLITSSLIPMFGLPGGPFITVASHHLSSLPHSTNLAFTLVSLMNVTSFPLGWLLKFGPLPVAHLMLSLILLQLLMFVHLLLYPLFLHASFLPPHLTHLFPFLSLKTLLLLSLT